jgi:hypothetical protein
MPRCRRSGRRFERRTFVYHYHADDRFKLPPEALIVLADENPRWRPTTYAVALKRTRLTFEVTPVKLLDWRGREDELRSHPNVMALFVLAHLEALRTRGDDEERARVKLDLYRRLVDRKLDDQDRYHWHKFLDWLLPLPLPMEKALLEEVRSYAGEKKMPYVTSAEKLARMDGLLEGLRTALTIKFGEGGLALMPSLQQVYEPDSLAAILKATADAATLDDVRKLLPATGEQAPS